MVASFAGAQQLPASPGPELSVTALAEQMQTGPALDWDHQAFQTLIDASSTMPTADERRLTLLALAGRYANANGLSSQAKANADFRRDSFRLTHAWRILQSLRVIRDGAAVEALIPILGTPSTVHDHADGTKTWQWYYNSPMHVNPVLKLKVKENVVVGCKIDRG
ncbi:MAG TPA: hypothetical protein VF595_12815 [Tepidisphaeraceae bacterium]|jgi:hypothetical protein